MGGFNKCQKLKVRCYRISIDHSLSPFIHSRFARQANLNIDYRPYKVESDEIDMFLKDFFADKNAIGLNVTLPLKKEAFNRCDSTSEEVSFIGALQTHS
ncbi:MAG: hypothetical protein Ct9H90mP6_10170 [Gammaproteobacteria bacterium]|nr:MAG: hypothetical protein Ct9H90mP6_10170 [Gammaproteobacteria bacterium]